KTSFNRFESSYAIYLEAAGAQENNAYTPGAGNNPLRQSLNAALTTVLTQGITPDQRLATAQQGLDFVAQLNLEVDSIGSSAPTVASAIALFEATANDPGNIMRRGAILKLATAARDQMTTIDTIRGLSYRADFETQQIFQRIIADKGVLSDD